MNISSLWQVLDRYSYCVLKITEGIVEIRIKGFVKDLLNRKNEKAVLLFRKAYIDKMAISNENIMECWGFAEMPVLYIEASVR